MSRLIDADALEELFREVIGNIAKKPEMNGNLEHMVRASAMVIEMIKDAPTIATEPHWIPVTERLPDKDGRYLVTCSKIGAWIVDWNIWHCEPKPGWLWEQGVTAWMPLHEPWEGEEKND